MNSYLKVLLKTTTLLKPHSPPFYAPFQTVKRAFSSAPTDRLLPSLAPHHPASQNTPNNAGDCPDGYLDSTLALIQFEKKIGPAWCGSFFYARKKPDLRITATRATPSPELKMVVNKNFTLGNYAGEEDMEVIRSNGERYVLPRRTFHDFYKLIAEDNIYSPRPRVFFATRIVQPISVIGVWGSRQNLPKDSVIVSDGNEAWGIDPECFTATYEPCKPQSLRTPWYV